MDPGDVKSSTKVYMIVFSTYLYSFTNDAAISWFSPVIRQLRIQDPLINPLGRQITHDEESWLASLLCLGNMVGLLPYGYLSYKFGRKYSLTSLGVLHIIAFLLFTTNSLTYFYIGRFLSGMAYGAGFLIFPMYIAEICKDSDRGMLVASRQIFSSCGTLFSYIFGNYLSIFWFNMILCIFPILFIISFTMLATESPYFYVMKEDLTKAREICVELAKVDDNRTDEEVDEIQKAVEMTQAENLAETLTRTTVLKATTIVYIMLIFQQLTGYMPQATYTEDILKKAHGIDPIISTISIGIIVLIGSILSTIFIDRKGRKVLLYTSLGGVVIAELAFTLYYFFFESSKLLAIISLAAFFLLFNIGLAFLPQMICAEILPMSNKFKIATTAGVFGYGIAFLLTIAFLDLNIFIGPGWTILGFATCSFVFLIIVCVFLPETKGRSFRQIQSMLDAGMEIE